MIGVLDSGVGGISVWKELVSIMGGEDYIYFSDGAFCPYGPKKPDTVRKRVADICGFLIDYGAEVIVVACNTATAAAITYLRSHFDIPFVGMEPAIKPAVLCSRSGVVGVLATAGTLKGRLYLDTLARFAGEVKVIERVGTGLVEFVERGIFEGEVVEAILRSYIEPMLAQGADNIVLGCTHYPFLSGTIEKIVGDRARVINPAPAVARQCRNILSEIRDLKSGCGFTNFISSGEMDTLKNIVRDAGFDYKDDAFYRFEI